MVAGYRVGVKNQVPGTKYPGPGNTMFDAPFGVFTGILRNP